MTLPGRHRWYEPVRDLPAAGMPGTVRLGFDFLSCELFEEVEESRDPADLARVVGLEERNGGALQTKVDGCWAALEIAGGAVASATSRSCHPLRQGVPWLGEAVDARLSGWTVIGELEAGTSRARAARLVRGELDRHGRSVVAPLLHVYSVRDPSGRERVAELPELPLHPRWKPVDTCEEPWEVYTLRVLEAGGEGVVIRRDDGLWRAKAEGEDDRVICGDVVENDRSGQPRRKLCLGAYAGRWTERLQWVECPPWWTLSQRLTHRAVVSVRHWGCSEDGVLRHAQIVGVREDKRPRECVI